MLVTDIHAIEDKVIAMRQDLVKYRKEVPLYAKESADRDHYATLAINLKTLQIAIGDLLSILPQV